MAKDGKNRSKARKRTPRSRALSRVDRTEGGEAAVRDRILDSACDLFYREGLQAVGIQRLLAEAGAAKASLYDHYGSKDALVAAYLERRAASWRALVDERLGASGADARTRLLLLFDLLADWIGSPEFRGCPFQNAAAELTDPRHPVHAVMARHRGWLHARVRSLVTEAGVRSAAALAGALVVLYDGAMAAALLDRDAHPGADARWAVERLLEAARSSAAC